MTVSSLQIPEKDLWCGYMDPPTEGRSGDAVTMINVTVRERESLTVLEFFIPEQLMPDLSY